MFCDRKAPVVAPDLISLLVIINHRVRRDDSIRRWLISLVCAVLEQWKVTGLHFNFNTQLQALLITQVAHKPDIYAHTFCNGCCLCEDTCWPQSGLHPTMSNRIINTAVKRSIYDQIPPLCFPCVLPCWTSILNKHRDHVIISCFLCFALLDLNTEAPVGDRAAAL